MTNSLDVLHYALAIGFLAISGSIVYLVYHIVQTLKLAQKVLEEAQNITDDLVQVKEGVKLGVIKLLGMFTNNRKMLRGR